MMMEDLKNQIAKELNELALVVTQVTDYYSLLHRMRAVQKLATYYEAECNRTISLMEKGK